MRRCGLEAVQLSLYGASIAQLLQYCILFLKTVATLVSLSIFKAVCMSSLSKTDYWILTISVSWNCVGFWVQSKTMQYVSG